MLHMTSLEKTTRFIHKTALLILPLAAAAIGHAAPITTIPAGSFNFGSLGSGSLEGVTSSAVSGANGSTATFVFSTTGTLAGASIQSGAAIPLSYDFDLDASVSSWNLDFELLDGSTVIGDSGAIAGDTAGPNDGALAMTTSATALVGDTLTEQVVLNVSSFYSDTQVARSIGTQGLGAPEPGTLGLTGSVLGIGLFYLRRRKRQA